MEHLSMSDFPFPPPREIANVRDSVKFSQIWEKAKAGRSPTNVVFKKIFTLLSCW